MSKKKSFLKEKLGMRNSNARLQEENNQLKERVSILESQLDTIRQFQTSERLQAYLNKVDKVQKLGNLIQNIADEDNNLSKKLEQGNKAIRNELFADDRNIVLPQTHEQIKLFSGNLHKQLAQLENDVDKKLAVDNILAIEDWNKLFEYEKTKKGIIIKKYIAFDEEEVTVPNTIEGYSVIEIGAEAFRNCTKMKQVHLPSTIKIIGKYAFQNCGLITMNLPSDLLYLGCFAFLNNFALEKIIFSNNIKRIQTGTLCDCSALKKIIFSKSIKSIENVAFHGCSSINSLDIPVGVESIGAFAFKKCSRLLHIRIPDSVIRIGAPVPAGDLYRGIFNAIYGGTIYCNIGSEALKYARKHNIKVDRYENYKENDV